MPVLIDFKNHPSVKRAFLDSHWNRKRWPETSSGYGIRLEKYRLQANVYPVSFNPYSPFNSSGDWLTVWNYGVQYHTVHGDLELLLNWIDGEEVGIDGKETPEEAMTMCEMFILDWIRENYANR